MFDRQGGRAAWAMVVVVAAGVLGAGEAKGGVTIYTGPCTSSFQAGYSLSVVGVGTELVAGNSVVVLASKQTGSITKSTLGYRGLRWDTAGNVQELDNLTERSDGYASTVVYFVNSLGAATGNSYRWNEMDQGLGSRAARWDLSGSVVELDAISMRSDGYTTSLGRSLNDAGTVVGWAQRFGALDEDLGSRAVRWDAGGTAATELEHLGTRSDGYTDSRSLDVNAGGTAVGFAGKYDDADSDLGQRAVRWDASSAAAVELDTLSVRADGYASSSAYLINDAGATTGSAHEYDQEGHDLGPRAVRWSATGTGIEELGTIGQKADGTAWASASAMNNAGTIVGRSERYDALGNSLGTRPGRWDASSTEVVELPTLRDRSDGYGFGWPWDINERGIVVGTSKYYDADPNNAIAVLWTPAGRLIDLNTVTVPDGKWKLILATDVEDDGWVTGWGSYDPDGEGGQTPYFQSWLLHVTYFSPGDFNLDGMVNVQDINPFVAAVTDGQGYQGYLAGRMSALGIDAGELELILQFVDPSGDGAINVQDINPFVAMMTGQGIEVDVSAIPEPGFGAVMVAAVVVGLMRRRG